MTAPERLSPLGRPKGELAPQRVSAKGSPVSGVLAPVITPFVSYSLRSLSLPRPQQE